MQCISCTVNIDPKWAHAINQNICPFCGQAILPDKLKSLLTSLGEIMVQLQEYPEQLNDWLLSNHNYIKTDSPDLPIYLPKDTIKELSKQINNDECQEKKTSTVTIKLPDGGTQEIVVEKLQSESKTKSFFDRAEAIKGSGKTSGKAPKEPGAVEAPKSIVEKTQSLKKLVQEIKAESAQGFISENRLASMISGADEMMPEIAGAAGVPTVQDLSAAIGSGDVISSAMPEAYTGEDDIPGENVVAALARQTGASGSNPNNQEKDILALQKVHNNVQGGQNKMLSGKGHFSR
jgi:hypothetical protein